MEVNGFGTGGNFNQQLRSASDVLVLVPCLANTGGADEQAAIRLRLILIIEDGRGVVVGLNGGCRVFVDAKPAIQPYVHPAVWALQRRWHVDFSSDEFRPGAGGHGLVAGVEGPLIEAVSGLQRWQRFFQNG